MKTIIALCIFCGLFCGRADASSYLTLEASQFVRQHGERQPVVQAELDLDVSNNLRFILAGCRSLDIASWRENRVNGTLKLDISPNVYLAAECERYYSRNENRYWFTIGTKVRL
jgi:hypothetical protein